MSRWNLTLSQAIQSETRTIPPVHISTLYPLPTCKSLSSRVVYQIDGHGITVLVFQSPSFYLTMAPKYKSRDAGNSDMPKRNHKVLHLSEKAVWEGKAEYMERSALSTVSGIYGGLGTCSMWVKRDHCQFSFFLHGNMCVYVCVYIWIWIDIQHRHINKLCSHQQLVI